MKSFPTPSPISITVQLAAGEIELHASDRTDTTVDVLPSYPHSDADIAAAEQTRVEFANGALTIIGAKGRGIGMLRKPGSVRVIVSVPTGSAADAQTGIGRVTSSGVLGECLVRTGAGDVVLGDGASLDVSTGVGDITAGQIAGNAKAKTGTGAVRIGDVGGSAHVRNSNGDTHLGAIGGTASVKSSNGKVSIDRARGDVKVATSNGDLSIGSVEAGSVDLRTALGRIAVGILDGVAAQLDVHTSYGNVITDMAPSSQPVSTEGTVQVIARTSAGDIVISRTMDTASAA